MTGGPPLGHIQSKANSVQLQKLLLLLQLLGRRVTDDAQDASHVVLTLESADSRPGKSAASKAC